MEINHRNNCRVYAENRGWHEESVQFSVCSCDYYIRLEKQEKKKKKSSKKRKDTTKWT